MKQYRILFSFMRGRRGELIDVPDEHAQALMDAGLIEPAKPGTAEARETRTVAPEIKEGNDAALPARTGRQPGTPPKR